MSKRKAAAPTTTPARRRSATVKGPTASAAAVAEAAEQELVTDSAAAAEPTEESAAEALAAADVASAGQGPGAEQAAAPPVQTPQPRSLDVFLIDSGWNTPVCAAVHENIPTMAAYLKQQRFFVLNQEQSLTYIRKHPAMVGADPILMVVDRHAAAQKGARVGFRLCLGHVKRADVAVSMLKWAMQLTMTASIVEMTKMVEQSGHRKTLQGVIELVGEGSAHLLEFAPV